jgi:uncharacterized protein YdeI (YjbR/CyaY-like superfamily)
MDIGQTLYIIDRLDWRRWLEANFDAADEIWLVYPKKSSGKARIVYNDAVEEALCFGWIDSIIKSLDEENTVQRFSPRKASNKSYSQPNKERLKWLLEHGMVHQSVEAAAREAVEDEFVFPADILESIRASEAAWQQFQSFSPAYRRIRIAYIESARERPEEFEKRLANFLKKTEEGKQIGFGGIDKYF